MSSMTEADLRQARLDAQVEVIRLENEVESVRDRMLELEVGTDDRARATTKLRHSRHRLVEARIKLAEIEAELGLGLPA